MKTSLKSYENTYENVCIKGRFLALLKYTSFSIAKSQYLSGLPPSADKRNSAKASSQYGGIFEIWR
jgi:hypothetical protein